MEFFDPGVFIIYKILRNSSRGFYYLQMYRKNRPCFGMFLGGCHLNKKQKPKKLVNTVKEFRKIHHNLKIMKVNVAANGILMQL